MNCICNTDKIKQEKLNYIETSKFGRIRTGILTFRTIFHRNFRVLGSRFVQLDEELRYIFHHKQLKIPADTDTSYSAGKDIG